MKKKLSKKLDLKKELIANLNGNEQRNINGGADLTFGCQTKEKESCSVAYICCIPPENKIDNG
ncbi:MAG: class I lanthipeptide [Candidatus Aminicenantes bacterium]|nr:class I lanthipeptide [Candidatus Aminicenantes bacterium]